MSEAPEGPIAKKRYRAESFAKSSIACPSCFLKIDEEVVECPRCQFSGSIAVQRFPFAAPAMERFVDPQMYFDEHARKVVGSRLEGLGKQFPQVRICFAALELPEHVDLREFGFWFFNASPVNDPSEAERRLWTILLLIDPAIGRATVVSGYAIEPFVRDDRWEDLLRSDREFFFKQDYVKIGTRFVDGAEKILREGAHRAVRKMGGQGMKRKSRQEKGGEE